MGHGLVLVQFVSLLQPGIHAQIDLLELHPSPLLYFMPLRLLLAHRKVG